MDLHASFYQYESFGHTHKHTVGTYILFIVISLVLLVFVEEKDEDYEFAIDETMTPEAFARAVGARVTKRSNAGVSVMAPISEHPTPDHGGSQFVSMLSTVLYGGVHVSWFVCLVVDVKFLSSYLH